MKGDQQVELLRLYIGVLKNTLDFLNTTNSIREEALKSVEKLVSPITHKVLESIRLNNEQLVEFLKFAEYIFAEFEDVKEYDLIASAIRKITSRLSGLTAFAVANDIHALTYALINAYAKFIEMSHGQVKRVEDILTENFADISKEISEKEKK